MEGLVDIRNIFYLFIVVFSNSIAGTSQRRQMVSGGSREGSTWCRRHPPKSDTSYLPL